MAQGMNGAWIALGVVGAVAAAGAVMGERGSMARAKLKNGESVVVSNHYGGVTRKIGRTGTIVGSERHKPSGGVGIGARDTMLYKVKMDDGGYVESYWSGELSRL